jgi:cytochrome c-type biogenesis protein
MSSNDLLSHGWLAAIGFAFGAGFVSFISPCVLPLVPAYLSLLTGSTLEELQGRSGDRDLRGLAVGHAIAFIIGFTVVFIGLGLTASVLGGVLNENKRLIAQVGGVIVIVLGLQMMGVLKIPFLMRDTRVSIQRKQRTYWTSGLVGIAFAAGWSPCIGPILAGILAIASQQHTAQAALLLLIYSLGLALPFFLTALAIGTVLPVLSRIKRYLRAIEIAAGVFMIAVGIVLVNNAFYTVAGWFYQFVPTPNL